jgi:hypothetical protein
MRAKSFAVSFFASSCQGRGGTSAQALVLEMVTSEDDASYADARSDDKTYLPW